MAWSEFSPPDPHKAHSQAGNDTKTGVDVAIKLEHISTDPSYLDDEVGFYKELDGAPGIPRLYAYESQDDYRAMIFQLLGPNLEDLFNFCGRKFSLKTVLMLADQLIYRLAHIHSKGIVHRDLKPENCLMGTGRYGNVVYLTDFGIAENSNVFVTPDDYICPQANQSPRLIGTSCYASIKGHLGTCNIIRFPSTYLRLALFLTDVQRSSPGMT